MANTTQKLVVWDLELFCLVMYINVFNNVLVQTLSAKLVLMTEVSRGFMQWKEIN